MQVLCGLTDCWGFQAEQTLWGLPVLCPGKHTRHCEVCARLQWPTAGVHQHLATGQRSTSGTVSGEPDYLLTPGSSQAPGPRFCFFLSGILSGVQNSGNPWGLG
jgi:hypothetical protein